MRTGFVGLELILLLLPIPAQSKGESLLFFLADLLLRGDPEFHETFLHDGSSSRGRGLFVFLQFPMKAESGDDELLHVEAVSHHEDDELVDVHLLVGELAENLHEKGDTLLMV